MKLNRILLLSFTIFAGIIVLHLTSSSSSLHQRLHQEQEEQKNSAQHQKENYQKSNDDDNNVENGEDSTSAHQQQRQTTKAVMTMRYNSGRGGTDGSGGGRKSFSFEDVLGDNAPQKDSRDKKKKNKRDGQYVVDDYLPIDHAQRVDPKYYPKLKGKRGSLIDRKVKRPSVIEQQERRAKMRLDPFTVNGKQLSKFLLLESLPPSWMGITNQMILFSEILFLAYKSGREAVVLPKRSDDSNNNGIDQNNNNNDYQQQSTTNSKRDIESIIDWKETEMRFSAGILLNNIGRFLPKRELQMRVLTFEEFTNLPFFMNNLDTFASKPKKSYSTKLKLPSRNLVLSNRVEARKQLDANIAKISNNTSIIRLGAKSSILWHTPFLTSKYFDDVVEVEKKPGQLYEDEDEVRSLEEKMNKNIRERNLESPSRLFDVISPSHAVREKVNHFLITNGFDGESQHQHQEEVNSSSVSSLQNKNHRNKTSSSSSSNTKNHQKTIIAVPFHLRLEPDIVSFGGTNEFKPPTADYLRTFLKKGIFPRILRRVFASIDPVFDAFQANSVNVVNNSNSDSVAEMVERYHYPGPEKKMVMIRVILFAGVTLDPKLKEAFLEEFANLEEDLNSENRFGKNKLLQISIKVFTTPKSASSEQQKSSSTNNKPSPTNLFDAAVDASIASAVQGHRVIVVGADYSTFTRAIQLKRCGELERISSHTHLKEQAIRGLYKSEGAFDNNVLDSLILYDRKLSLDGSGSGGGAVREVVVESKLSNCYATQDDEQFYTKKKKKKNANKKKMKSKQSSVEPTTTTTTTTTTAPKENSNSKNNKDDNYFAEPRSVLDNPYATVPHSYVPKK